MFVLKKWDTFALGIKWKESDLLILVKFLSPKIEMALFKSVYLKKMMLVEKRHLF